MLMSSLVELPVQPSAIDAAIESHVEIIMQELLENNDQVKFMESRSKQTEEFAFLAEARFCSAEQAFDREVEQNEILADMAKQVSSGTAMRLMHIG
ncbi:MAG: hypothetical protein ACKPKO_11035, partial [Candidatus Fonsibacter sp.]